MQLRFGRRAALGLGAALALPAIATAQVIQRTARIVIGFPPGGSSDVVARLYAERLRGIYAPTLVVDGRVGAAGRIAVEHVRDAEKDGSVYLQTPASMLTLQPHVFPREVRYDALTDLIPVSTVCTFPFTFAVPASHPARTLAQLVDWLRAQPGEVPFASPAAGSAPHFLGVMFARKFGLRLTHVPYRGAVPAVQDLIGGRLPLFVGVLGDVSPQHGSGRAHAGHHFRPAQPRYPDVPTMAELGHADLSKDEWFGALLPAGTPAHIVQGLHASIARVAAMPDMVAALERLEFSATVSASPEDFAARIRRERDEWGPIVRDSGFQPEN